MDTDTELRWTKNPRFCTIEGCDGRAVCRGWCRKHYGRWERHGDPTVNLRAPKGCSVEGCDDKHFAVGLCQMHYDRQRRRGTIEARVKKVRQSSLVCEVEGCDKLRQARGMCPMHYARWRGDGELTRRPPRRGTINQHGYTMVWAPEHPQAYGTGYVPEHRMVMSNKLGRPLVKGENVHHINGVKTDNRPENLELWVTKQPQGQRVPDLLVWAREIVALYGDLDPATYT